MNNDQNIAEPTLPMHVKKIYPVYANKKVSKFLDSDKILNLLTFGNRKKLVQSLLREIEQSADYIQIGVTFGSQIEKVADKIGYYGNYHLVDVSKVQIERIKDKYKGIQQNINFSNQNGLAKIPFQYDGVICFMLLHQLPPHTRKKLVNNLLSSVKDRGKVIFIDFHKPNGKILSKFTQAFHRLYNPFAEDLINQEIFDSAENKDAYFWNKSVMFDGAYQKVVAIKK
ncbi:MAG: methyltransferase [Alphaproteobacteria bacterium]